MIGERVEGGPKKILIVEDDISLSTTLKNLLQREGFNVQAVTDGVAAKNLIALEDFELVISDIRVPNLNGIQLLHHIKRTKEIPVILMTGFSEISEAKEAYDLGAKGFLPKPFGKGDLLNQLSGIFGIDKPKQDQHDEQFSALRIEEFVTGKEILFDIYVKIRANKYVKVASSGESIDVDRVVHYREKGLEYLYLKKDDFMRYLGFSKALAQKVAKAEHIEHSRKVSHLAQQSKMAMKGLYREKVNPENFGLAVDLVSTAVETMCQQPEAFEIFEVLKGLGDPIYTHSLAVSVYSTLVAKHLGWKSPRTLIRLSMAGMMHDIGKKEINPEILKKPRIALTAAEINELETHTSRGYEILREIPDVPDEVAQTALQHHEDCRGCGYPMRLTRNHIIPLARLIAVVDEFCELCFPPNSAQKPLTAEQALSRVASDAAKHDSDFFKALFSVFRGETQKIPGSK